VHAAMRRSYYATPEDALVWQKALYHVLKNIWQAWPADGREIQHKTATTYTSRR
jgi:hypothetical protein